MSDRDRRRVEEHIARELLNYFTGEHPTGVRYENQPPEVRELWLGAARVAVKALQASGGERKKATTRPRKLPIGSGSSS
jgi:hypothetical protein